MTTFVVAVIVGVLVGWVSAALLALTEPFQRWMARRGRRLVRDPGVQMHVETDPAVIWAGYPDWIGFHYFVPELEDGRAPPENPREWRNWVVTQGGWDLWKSLVRVTLVADGPSTVVVESPQVNVRTSEAPQGQKIVHPVGGASIQPRSFAVSLDTFGAGNPTVHLIDQDGDYVGRPLSFSLAKGEAEQFLIEVDSERSKKFEWSADIPIIVDGGRQYLAVGSPSDPFTFVGGTLGDFSVWDGNAWSGGSD